LLRCVANVRCAALRALLRRVANGANGARRLRARRPSRRARARRLAHPLSSLRASSRHRAQGTHNLAVLEAGGQDGGSGVAEAEYKNWEWLDARLTPLGESQARALRPTMAAHRVDVVLTSPLSRTIQTALLAIPEGPPFVVEDGCRERIGTHPCDKRRSRAELRADFPRIVLDGLAAEEDDKWTEAREPEHELNMRAGRFCATLAARPEEAIAVVTHNDFLTALLFSSALRLATLALRKKFANCEHMALVLTWRPQPAGEGGDAGAGGAKEVDGAHGGAAAVAAASSVSKDSAAE